MTYSFRVGAFFIFFLSATSLSNAQTIKEKHLPTYIMDCLDYWFYPNHNHPQISSLGRSIYEEVINSSNYEYEWDWSSLAYEIVYPLDYVEQIIRGAIIQHIASTSYDYAREIASRENARRISEYIYNYLFNYCSKTAILPQGIFAGCVGNDLRNWVWQIYTQATPGYAPASY